MKQRPCVPRVSAALCALLLLSCGGIEGTGSPVAGIEGTGFTEGSATGFGSVYVNGIEFSTDRAEIRVDGVVTDEAALKVGMVLRVSGDIAEGGLQGVASRISTGRQLHGPVEAVDPERRRLTVLGQSISLDDRTVFGGIDEDNIQNGAFLSVNGHFTRDGVLATLLQAERDAYVPGESLVEVEGGVSDLSQDAFRIGGLNVNYSTALVDRKDGVLVEGVHVEVVGRQHEPNGVLQAEQVRVLPGLVVQNGQPLSLEGVIQQFTAPHDIVVSGQTVDLSSAVRTDDTPLELDADVRIRVSGVVHDGLLRAAQYALLPAGEYSMGGRVDDFDPDMERVTVLGHTQQALADTQYLDLRDGERRFRLKRLRVGDYVELRGFSDHAGRLMLSRIERREELLPPPIVRTHNDTLDERIQSVCTGDCLSRSVRGRLIGKDDVAGRLQIGKVNVNTNAVITRFFDRDGNQVTAVEFFGNVNLGDRLIAEGQTASDRIIVRDMDAIEVRYARFQF